MKHISLDFWNTIAKPNAIYARERSQLLADVFNTRFDIAKATYTRVKRSLDYAAETMGCDHGRAHNINALCAAFDKKTDQQFVKQLHVELDRLFILNPPTIDEGLIYQLDRAHDMGITLSIGSNTNFIEGHTIMSHVIGNRIPFAFTIFSDEICCSKPNPLFFEQVTKKARDINPKITDNRDIVHIGDNDICDCKGADAAGMRYAFTENADQTARVIRNILSN